MTRTRKARLRTGQTYRQKQEWIALLVTARLVGVKSEVVEIFKQRSTPYTKQLRSIIANKRNETSNPL